MPTKAITAKPCTKGSGTELLTVPEAIANCPTTIAPPVQKSAGRKTRDPKSSKSRSTMNR